MKLDKTQKAKRSENEILRDIAGVYTSLSPENLSCDGELSAAETRRRAVPLQRQLKALFTELGREVSEEEAFYT